MLSKILLFLIRAYQILFVWLPPSCRFEPSCSAYAQEAVKKHGAVKGAWLTTCRLGRCRPGCKGGYDPVP